MLLDLTDKHLVVRMRCREKYLGQRYTRLIRRRVLPATEVAICTGIVMIDLQSSMSHAHLFKGNSTVNCVMYLQRSISHLVFGKH